MAPLASAALILPAAATALMAMVTAMAMTAANTPPPAAIRLPGCNTTCGNVSVPYPFGFGPSHCYWPGLNLTCDTRQQPARLLLGDGTIRVAGISLWNETVRVMRSGYIIYKTGDLFTSDGWNASLDFGRGFKEHGYILSSQNELVVFGCNVVASLSAEVPIAEGNTMIVSGCASFCAMIGDAEYFLSNNRKATGKYCTGMSHCCQAPFIFGGVPTPNGVQVRWLYGGNHTTKQPVMPVSVFVAEQGWADKELTVAGGFEEAPLLLHFALRKDLPQLQANISDSCPQDIYRKVCKSEHSHCNARPHGYTCGCDDGYDGNPYLADGCQDVDECKLLGEHRVCFGVCTNTIGSHDCWCPQGTYGQPDVEGGCVDYNFHKDAMSPTVAGVPTGMPGCNTTCGDVRVPYPFGFGPSRCYWPGFNLTCDTSHNPPRLLLHGNGNGTLEVVDISLQNSTARVIHHDSSTDSTIDVVDDTWAYDNITTDSAQLQAAVCLPTDVEEPYVLSTRNELIVFSGWDVRASLHEEYRNGSSSSNTTDSIISQAVCSSSGGGLVVGDRGSGEPPSVPTQTHREYCSGHDGCCHGLISSGSLPKRVEFNVLNDNINHHYGNWPFFFAFAFISEVGFTDQWHKIFNLNDKAISYMSSPIVLQWAVKEALLAPAANNSGQCPVDVVSRLCKSEHSYCRQENGGFTCHCTKGYDGNPYIASGCQDIDECNIPEHSISCLGGYCYNLPGHYECRCPRGTHGNASQPEGCTIRSPTGLIIGLTIASGLALVLLVLGILFLLHKLKQRRSKLLKKKYFKKNRGHLLSQNADIAERMIIPLDELVKATNNFDKDRELGGGAHGTVYKGILSDLHVVAIKKSKITVQKDIEEFINEVAILSQINHKNVVKLFGCCLETEVPLLVYEFISNGTLYQHLHVQEPKSLSWGSRLRIATEIATSLAYLHSSVSPPIIHRDIKSVNILLDDKMTSKIADFGASRYIKVENTGLITGVQGTIGYLDPMYYQTFQLTEKSDVYSFGVILMELLTKKKPTSYLSTEGRGLVSHFVNLLSEGNLSQIIDTQVIEEGGTEVQEVATLAASCINSRVEERPSMRQVEHALHGLQGPNSYNRDGIVAMEPRNDSITMENPSLSGQGQRYENQCTRRYSLEQEMMMSASYPR